MNPSVIQKNAVTQELSLFEADLLSFFHKLNTPKFPKPEVIHQHATITRPAETLDLSMQDHSFDESALRASKLDVSGDSFLNNTISVDANRSNSGFSDSRFQEGSKILKMNTKTMTVRESDFSKGNLFGNESKIPERRYTTRKTTQQNRRRKGSYKKLNHSIHKLTKSRKNSGEKSKIEGIMGYIPDDEGSVDKEKSLLDFKNQSNVRRKKRRRNREGSLDQTEGISITGFEDRYDDGSVSGISHLSLKTFFVSAFFMNKRQNELFVSSNNKLMMIDIHDITNIYIKMNVRVKNIVVG